MANSTTNIVSIPHAGGNLSINMTFDGLASFRLYRCVPQGGSFVVDAVLEANGHGDSNAPANYATAPPAVGSDIILYLQMMLTAIVVPADVSADIVVSQSGTSVSQTHIPAHITEGAIPVEVRLQFHGI